MNRALGFAACLGLSAVLFFVLGGPQWVSRLGTDTDSDGTHGDLLTQQDAASPSPAASAVDPTLAGFARGSIQGTVHVQGQGTLRASVRVAGVDAAGRFVDVSVRVGADGTFHVPDLPSGNEYVLTIDAGYTSRVIHPVVVRDGETVLGPIEIDTRMAIEGTVRDETHRAVAGARVWLMRDQRGYYRTAHLLLPQQVYAETKTDESGRFRFPNVAGEYFLIAAHKAGFKAAVGSVAILDGRQVAGPERLVLGTTRVTRGQVMHHDGRPVVGAAVALFTKNGEPGGMGRTDAQGRFALPGERGSYGNRVLVRLGDALWLQAWPETGDARVVVPAPTRLSIRMVGAADERARSGVVVQARIDVPDQAAVQSFEAVTDATGHVTFDAFEGTLERVGFIGHHGTLPRIDDQPGFSGPADRSLRTGKHTTYVYRMPHPERRVITGRVVDPTGRPLPGTHCGLQTGKHYWHGDATGADGRYRLALDPEVDGVFEIRRPGFLRHYVSLAQLSGAKGMQIRYDVTLERGATLVGTVVDANDRPVAGARVFADCGLRMMVPPPVAPPDATPALVLAHAREVERYHWSGETVTAADGTFAIGGVLPGLRVDVGARHGDYQSWRRVRVETTNAPIQAVGRVQIFKGAVLRARVLRHDGSLATGARVRAGDDVREGWEAGTRTMSCRWRGHGVVDASGHVRIEDLYSGVEALIEVRLPGTGGALITRTLHRDDEKSLEIRLRPATRVAGRLIDDRGRAVPDVPIHLLVDEKDPQHHEYVTFVHHVARTDADGGFAFTDIPPNPVQLVVNTEGYHELRTPVAGRGTLELRLAPIDPALRDRREKLNAELATLRHGKASDDELTEKARERVRAIDQELAEIWQAEEGVVPKRAPQSDEPCRA